MKKYQKEIIKISAEEVLLSIFNFAAPFFESSRIYRISVKDFRKTFNIDKSSLGERIKYLKRHGLIENFVEGKRDYIEITLKGAERIAGYNENNLIIERPEKWDGKWRIVIFDIPNKQKSKRDLFRLKLLKMNFIKVQESIYVYPFDCTDTVASLTMRYSISESVLIMVSEIIQGEDMIIEKFLEKNILTQGDLSK